MHTLVVDGDTFYVWEDAVGRDKIMIIEYHDHMVKFSLDKIKISSLKDLEDLCREAKLSLVSYEETDIGLFTLTTGYNIDDRWCGRIWIGRTMIHEFVHQWTREEAYTLSLNYIQNLVDKASKKLDKLKQKET